MCEIPQIAILTVFSENAIFSKNLVENKLIMGDMGPI